MNTESPIPAAQGSSKPWHRLHRTTLFFLIAVAAALIDLQMIGTPNSICRSFGWPLQYQTATGPREKAKIVKSLQARHPGGIITISDLWMPLAIIPDAVCSVGLIISVIFACEWWSRRRCSIVQFDLRSLFILVSVCSVIVFAYTKMFLVWDWSSITPAPHDRVGIYHLNLYYASWWIRIPILFGVGCTVFALGAAMFWIIARIGRRFWRPTATINLGP